MRADKSSHSKLSFTSDANKTQTHFKPG